MATANFYDYAAEEAALKQQQAIVEAMRARASAPSTLPSSVAAGAVMPKVNPLEYVAKALQSGMARRKETDLEAKRRELSERYNTDLRNGLEQFQQTSQGKPMEALPEELAGPPQPAVPGDPRKAVLDALSSGHPVLQKIAMERLNAKPDQIGLEKLMGIATPESVIANPNDPSKWQPKRELKAVAPGEVMIDAGGNLAQPGGNPQNGWKTVNIGGDLYQQTATGLRKLDNATKITNNVSMGAGNKFAEKISEQRANILGKSYEETRGLPQTLTVLDEASTALAGGIKSGQLGDVALTIAKVGKSLGLEDATPEIANTEVYRSSLANSVLDILKTLRPASDKDVEYAQKAAGGSITLDDATMLRLIDSAKVAAANKLFSHNQLLEKNRKASGAIDEDLDTFNIPFSVSGDGMEFKNGRFVSTLAGKPVQAKQQSGSTTTPKLISPTSSKW